MKARLVLSREVGPNTRHFEFETAEEEPLAFEPGQFVSVTQRIADDEITRAYSIASPPRGNRFALCANLVPDGENQDRHFTLIFGVRHEEGLLYHDEFVSLKRDYPGFHYRPTLTRPPEGWKGLTGRVQPHALAALGERRDVDVYICGLREMVDELRLQLKAAGLDRKRIIYEKYD